MAFDAIDEILVDPARARVYEHGWQSWSPTTTYPVTATSSRPAFERRRIGSYRPGAPAPVKGFQGEGVLGLDPGDDGPVVVWAASGGPTEIPSIRASLVDGRLLVAADGLVARSEAATLPEALGAWADGFAARAGVSPPRPAPTGWCSWYHYYRDVTDADIAENVADIARHDLPVDVVQIDDGWEAAVGDWLDLSGRFRSLDSVAARIRNAGRRAGIWVAPFVATEHSALVRDHPDWLIGDAGIAWDVSLFGLDLTHPGVRAYLVEVFGSLRRQGFDYFKIDFVYAGALPGPRYAEADGLHAYRSGLELIREAIGPDAYLLGCGAPILPSVGLVDAMRVSPDVATHNEPPGGDLSQPSVRSAAMSTVGRAWQHGRFWVNDPDCLIARPEVQRRAEWAGIVERYGGLRVSSDRIAALDPWGMATTRRLLSEAPPPTPFADLT